MIITPSQAEVQLMHNTLTVNIHNTTMKDVLDDLRHEADLNIVAFEESKVGNVRISKTFWNLPLEIGLDRLLNGWNYGISRDALTGKITTLYLVSRRSDVSTLPWPLPSSDTSLPSRNDFESSTQSRALDERGDDSESYAFADEEAFDEFTAEDDSRSEEEFENLEPELREQLEELYRNNDG
jgi:hypothetical protein